MGATPELHEASTAYENPARLIQNILKRKRLLDTILIDVDMSIGQ
jgi:hypothetical protein